MIFNAFSYFFLFLLPAAVLFRLVPALVRAWVLVASGEALFVYFSVTTVGGNPADSPSTLGQPPNIHRSI